MVFDSNKDDKFNSDVNDNNDNDQITQEIDEISDKIADLNKKQGKTAEEEQQLEDLKKERKTKTQRRIDMIISERKALEWEKKQAEEEKEKLQKELDEIKNKPRPASVSINKTVVINGQEFYTDAALSAMIKSGDMTEVEAIAHQQARNEESMLVKVEQRQEQKRKQQEMQEIRKKDIAYVQDNYPAFDPKHPDHNPKDPLYLKVNELWNESYQYLPDGLSKAIRRAKEILRISDTRPDRSDDLSIHSSSVSIHQRSDTNGSSKIVLNDNEKEIAIRQFCKGDVINPKTRRPYTEREAIERATLAKREQVERRKGA